MISHPPFEPFKGYFETIQQFEVIENCDEEIKKWLYNQGIPFSKYVFINTERSGHAVMLTWKMVIKYWEGLFFADDLVIFDSSLEWGLYYFHEDIAFFGRDVKFDRAAELAKVEWVNGLRKKATTNKK